MRRVRLAPLRQTSPCDLAPLPEVTGAHAGQKILRFVGVDDAEKVIDTEESEREWKKIMRGPKGGSGWSGGGQPQCYACRRIMSGYGKPCPDCYGHSQDAQGHS